MRHFTYLASGSDMGRWTKVLFCGAIVVFIASIAIGVGLFKWQGVSYEFVRDSGPSPRLGPLMHP
ncbi:hypothetical protein SAMN05443245_7282 [Paraburkholderia fungorum]|uniref:Uncharacterized protein n=1 Tax=Paraburkholderia fungorum TaxID=134537 RepID=A0A1H1JV37_9BURK|nr:hypothetical protein SAMN05443245_7282 [Paraburkholderia fungorum]